MTISGGERVAIIGRTGAGKTSLTAALFRLTEVASGNIEIDGIDIAQTSLQDLHSRLSIILKIQRSSRALFAATSIRSTPMKTVSSALPSDTPTSPTTMAFPKSRHKIRQNQTKSQASILTALSTKTARTSPRANVNSSLLPAPWSATARSSCATVPHPPSTLSQMPPFKKPSGPSSAAKHCSSSLTDSIRGQGIESV
jgi:hypothetical protein